MLELGPGNFELGVGWLVKIPPGIVGLEGSGASKALRAGGKAGVPGAALRNARAQWKTKSSKKRSLQKSKVV